MINKKTSQTRKNTQIQIKVKTVDGSRVNLHLPAVLLARRVQVETVLLLSDGYNEAEHAGG